MSLFQGYTQSQERPLAQVSAVALGRGWERGRRLTHSRGPRATRPEEGGEPSEGNMSPRNQILRMYITEMQ